jgi:hypothetical protein
MIAAATQPVIRFEEEGHRYFVDDREVHSWSKCMEDAGLLPTFPDTAFAKVANAKHRGRQIHEACAIFLRGQPLDVTQLHDESLPYVQAFVDYWRKEAHVMIPASSLHAETPLYNAELDYCCTPDFHTPVAVYDIKTTDRPSKTWGLQTAAQRLAHGGQHRAIVWLRPKLKSRNYELLAPPDPRVFTPHDFDVVREVCKGEYDGPAITAWKALK